LIQRWYHSGSRLKGVKESSSPLALHVILTPITLADRLSDQIGNYVWTFWKSILGGIGLFFVTYVLYYNPPVAVASFIHWMITGLFSWSHWTLSWMNWQMICTLNVVYLGYVVHFVMVYRYVCEPQVLTEVKF